MLSSGKWLPVQCLLIFRAVSALLAFWLLAQPQVCSAADAVVEWNPSISPSANGYFVRLGTGGSNAFEQIDAGNTATLRLRGLNDATTYFVSVAAYNEAGVSEFSEPVSVTLPHALPPDSDGDGLTDEDELARGTNPLLADSDTDGVDDRQEIVDGTNPLDAGSGNRPLPQRICTEWNAALSGMWNIVELVNVSSRRLNTVVTLYSQAGVALSERSYAIIARAQQDALVHDFQGFSAHLLGNVCIAHDGNEGDLDGRMVYYKRASAKSLKLKEQYDFAFALPFSGGLKGRQYVFFDTLQRSDVRSDYGNLIANWIQLTNLGQVLAGGMLRFYDTRGTLLGAEQVHLGPNERRDVSAHQFGPNHHGFVEWEPNDTNNSFQLRNVSYLYDNSNAHPTFASAFQGEGLYPSGESLLVPLNGDERQIPILKVANVLDRSIAISVHYHAPQGGSMFPSSNLVLPPKSTWTQSLDRNIASKTGFAVITSGVPNSLVSGVLETLKTKKGQIGYQYFVSGKPGYGSVLQGSFNTFLGQRSVLWIMNGATSPQSISVSAVLQNGQTAIAPKMITLPARGLRLVTIPNVNQYGVVTVQTNQHNSLVSWVQRTRADFTIPTPVRE